MFKFLKKKHGRLDFLRSQLGEFAHENKEVLVIVADPETDQIFVAYKDKMVLSAIKSLEGIRMNVVKNVVRQSAMKSEFDAAIDLFLASVVDVLKVPLTQGNHFYTHIADVLFAFQERGKQWMEKRAKVDAILSNQVK